MKTSFNNCLSKKNFGINKTKFLFITVFSFSFYFTSAQTDFRPGYYITWDNDTIWGLIDYRGEIRNSSFCSFKENANAKPIQFKPSEIKAYRFTDSKYYVSKKIKIGDQEKQVFIEFLVNGIADLYYHASLNNPMYLIEDRDGNLIELTDETKDEYVEGTGLVRKADTRYIGLLKATFSDCMEIQHDIEDVKLEHKYLIRITKKYHDYVCDDEKCIVYEKTVAPMHLRIAPIAGISTSKIRFSEGQFSGYEFEPNYFPFAGILLNTTIPRLNEKLSVEFETILHNPQYNGTYNYYNNSDGRTDYFESDINILALQPSLSLRYTRPKGIFRPTLAVGFSSDFILSKEQKTIRESELSGVIHTTESYDTPLESMLYGFIFQLGCNYNIANSHTFFTNLKLNYLTKNKTGARTIMQSASISLGMFFDIKK